MTPRLKALVSGDEVNKINGKKTFNPDVVLILSIGVFAPISEVSIHASSDTLKDYREMEADEASIKDILVAGGELED